MVKVPEKVTVKIDGKTVTLSGPAGKASRTFKARNITIEKEGDEVVVKGAPMRLVKTIEAHLANMLNGASSGYQKKLKIIYAHFPITAEVKGKEIVVKNFLGEKQPRHAAIIGETKVEPKGKEIVISGPDKEDVGQTVANLKAATRIVKYDCRVFQDGFYLVRE